MPMIAAEGIYRKDGTFALAAPLPLKDNQRVSLLVAPLAELPTPIDDDEFLRLLDSLPFDEPLPGLPTDFSRADLYADHD